MGNPADSNDKKPYISVAELGKILGLGKTESYRVLHQYQDCLETEIHLGKIWIKRQSFENWYKTQLWYRKVDGEAPGAKICLDTYSVQDIRRILCIHKSTVYCLINTGEIEAERIAGKTRIPKESFDAWHAANPDRFRKKLSKAKTGKAQPGTNKPGIKHPETTETKDLSKNAHPDIADPDAAASGPGGQPRKNPAYCGVQEAARIAGVSKATVFAWISSGDLKAVKIGRSDYISREELRTLLRQPAE